MSQRGEQAPAGSGRPVVRMRDVAAAAGVSVKTVSNVVNGTGQVRDATGRRVRAAVEELGYRPNPLARGLNALATDTITLAVPGLGYGYCAPLVAEVFDLAEARGISVVVEPTGGERERELGVLRDRSGLCDGVLLMPAAVTAADLAALPSGTPAVLLGAHLESSPLDTVAFQDRAAAEAAVRFLLECGARRVVLLGEFGQSAAGAAAQRSAGHRRALEAAGHRQDPALVLRTPASSREAGHEAVRRLLAEGTGFDAVLALEDPLAHGALRALRSAGRDVPGQVQVVAFGNDEDAEYAVPSLTAVRADLRTMARHALDLLAARVRDGAGGRRQVDIPFTIIQRESTISHG
ncbi:LacI family DNA-binding transcriptional regulator [Streptomyces olivaceus]|uniref:LacI family DNA-binding transcriptional regulator n=1 Tax=Streptomyces olivaceus TaxID=47716 RepID=UPI0036ECAB06